MPQEIVDLVRWSYAEFARRGEPAWELFASEVELDATDVMPDAEVIRSKEAAEAALEAYVGTFEDFYIELERVVAADRRLLVVSRRDRVEGNAKLREDRSPLGRRGCEEERRRRRGRHHATLRAFQISSAGQRRAHSAGTSL